jgi:hypothetical protein
MAAVIAQRDAFAFVGVDGEVGGGRARSDHSVALSTG